MEFIFTVNAAIFDGLQGTVVQHLIASVPGGRSVDERIGIVFAVLVVIAEVEIGSEVGEEGHLKVELKIADRLISFAFRNFCFIVGYRVEGGVG